MAEKSAQLAASPERSLVEQKMKLLETYLASPKRSRLAESVDPEVTGLIADAQEKLVSARQALEQDQLTLASSLIDLGLQSMAKASSIGGRARPQQDSKQSRARYLALQRQIDSYLAAMEDLFREPALQASHGADLQRIEALKKRSRGLAETDEYGRAATLLEEANAITLRVVSEVNQGRTAVARLVFAGPEEEFDYESKRHKSYEMLVSIMLSQAGSSREMVEAAANQFLEKGQLLRSKAEAEAREGHHEAAIDTMEQATRQLVYALRAGGVVVPE